MKIKPQRPRSCLGWFAWLFGILFVLFAISYNIDMWRLTSAWNEAYTLAVKLGYTPERHLTDRAPRDINIVPVFGACEVKVFFTTPLNRMDFASHLEQAGAHLEHGSPRDGRNMYMQLPFVVDGHNTETFSLDQKNKLPPVYESYWLVDDEKGRIKIVIFYSELSQTDAIIEYAGQPITENAAYVNVKAGRFPIWTFMTGVCARSKDLQRWMRR